MPKPKTPEKTLNTIEPLRSFVIVKRTSDETVSTGGIVLPAESSEKTGTGTVIAVGPGKERDDGTIRPMTVAVGDTVLFGLYGGVNIKVADQELLAINEDDVVGVFRAK